MSEPPSQPEPKRDSGDVGVATPHLLRRAENGDGPAVRTLLERYLPGLRAFVRLNTGKLLRGKESSSDLVQSACREVLENAAAFEYGDEAGFKLWLYRTALRKIQHRHQYWRAQKRDPGRERDARTAASGDESGLLSCYGTFCTPSHHAAAREELERVEAAFDRLPEAAREVIVLAKIVGLPRAEVAAQMGRTEVAVRTLLSRALAQLADELVGGG